MPSCLTLKPQVRPKRGVESQDDPGNEPLSIGGASLLCVWGDRSLCKGLSSLGDFPCLAQGAFKLQRGKSAKEDTHPEKSSEEVTM